MKRRPKMSPEAGQALAHLVSEHGFTQVIRAANHLASVTLWMWANDTYETPTQAALSRYWREPIRTVEREAAAWRQVSGGRDLGDVARAALEAGSLHGVAETPSPAAAAALVPFLTP